MPSSPLLGLFDPELRLPALFSSEKVAEGWFDDGLVSSGLTYQNVIDDELRYRNAEGDGCVFPDSSVGVWESTTNQLLNGDFETNTTGWGALAGTITRDTTESKFGGACGRFDWTGADTTYQTGPSATISGATAGRTFTCSVWVKANASAVGDNVQVAVTESGGATGEQTTGSSLVALTADWQRLTATRTLVQNDRTLVKLFLISPNGGAGDAIYIDGAQVEERPFATPYVHTDGATAARAAGSIVAPASVLSAATSWLAFRVRVGVPSSNTTWGSVFLGSAGTSDSTGFRIAWAPSNNAWRFWRGNSTSLATGNQTFAVGSYHTLTVYWSGDNSTGTRGISINGGAFTTTASNYGGAITLPATWQIGSRWALDQQGNMDFLWVLAGTGTLTDADAAAIHANGNTDPTEAPGSATFGWVA